jgi:hypothetical protein
MSTVAADEWAGCRWALCKSCCVLPNVPFDNPLNSRTQIGTARKPEVETGGQIQKSHTQHSSGGQDS